MTITTKLAATCWSMHMRSSFLFFSFLFFINHNLIFTKIMPVTSWTSNWKSPHFISFFCLLQIRMNSTDESLSPLSSLSAASSYSSLVNCDDPHQQTTPVDRNNSKMINGYNNINKRSPHSTLLPRHLNKLLSIFEQPVEIHGQGNFPTLNIVVKDFLIELRRNFHVNQIEIKDICLNGGKNETFLIENTLVLLLGAASYVLTNDKSFSYTDIDFVFRCDLSSESTWTQIKTIVCECLSQQIPSSSSPFSFSPIIIQTAYVEKIVRVINPSNNDSWALISLYNTHGQNIELKFVDRMKRQFQFSVDSFQILLDPLLNYYEQICKCQQQSQRKQHQYHHHHGKHQLVITEREREQQLCIRSSLIF